MGQSGALAMLFLLFLAVTSAVSTEQVAVSNILTYDVYAAYINPHPTEKQILWVSRVTILAYCFIMGGIATAFNYIGVSMGYLYVLMGCIIGCAVVPVAMCVSWKRCNGTGATVGAITGFVVAIAGWLGTTSALNNGTISIETTFQDYPMLTGNLLSIGIGGIITIGWSLVRPANFDWEITRAINCGIAEQDRGVVEHASPMERLASPAGDMDFKGKQGVSNDSAEVQEAIGSGAATPLQMSGSVDDKNIAEKGRTVDPIEAAALEAHRQQMLEELDIPRLNRAFRFAAIAACSLTFILIFAIPLPLFFSSHSEPALRPG